MSVFELELIQFYVTITTKEPAVFLRLVCGWMLDQLSLTLKNIKFINNILIKGEILKEPLLNNISSTFHNLFKYSWRLF